MNRATLASLHEIKDAVLQQQTLALRDIRARLDGLEAERGAILAGMDGAAPEASVGDATQAARYRALQQQRLGKLATSIASAARLHRKAEEDLSVTFAEIRAIEKLMEG